MKNIPAHKSGKKLTVICVLIALICTFLSGYSIYRVISSSTEEVTVEESLPVDSVLQKTPVLVEFNSEDCGEIYLLTGNSLTLVPGCVSDDETIAVCADGIVTANQPGRTRISVIEGSTKLRYWTLVVSGYEDLVLPIAKTHQLTTVGEGSSWNSSDSSVATVDETGLIKPRKVGTCVITGEDANGRQYAYNVSIKKTAYITIDDWPDKNTVSMLDVLDKYNIKATFFLCAQKKNKAVYQRIVDSGHAIGNHTYSHDIDYLYKTSKNMCDNVYKMDDWMLENFNVKTKLLRYPGGYYGRKASQRQSYDKLTQKGYRVFDWTCALGDTKYTKADDLMYNLKRLLKDDVEIILMHNKKHTAAVFEDVVRYILEKDYVCLPLDEQSPTYDFVHDWNYK